MTRLLLTTPIFALLLAMSSASATPQRRQLQVLRGSTTTKTVMASGSKKTKSADASGSSKKTKSAAASGSSKSKSKGMMSASGTFAPSNEGSNGDLGTFAPTETGAALQQTVAPTEVGTVATTMAETEVVAPQGPTCQDNPKSYAVGIDLQLSFADSFYAACEQSEDEEIDRVISETLNKVFPDTVPDWDGDAVFGPSTVDFFQEINNLDPFARKTRGLRHSKTSRRRLQESEAICPARLDAVCEGDYCRWSCLTAETTDCGTSALTSWVNLGEDIATALAALTFECLGDTNELKVTVAVDPENKALLDDGIDGELADRMAPADQATAGPESSEAPSEVDEATSSPESSEAPSDVPDDAATSVPESNDAPSDAPTESPANLDDVLTAGVKGVVDSDATTKIHAIDTELVVTFFKVEDVPSRPDLQGILNGALTDEAKAFFVNAASLTNIASDFVAFDITNVDAKYNAEETTLKLKFTSVIDMKLTSKQTAREVAMALTDNVDFKKYLADMHDKQVYLQSIDFAFTGAGD